MACIGIQVERIDIYAITGGNLNHSTVECLSDRCVLTIGVDDVDICISLKYRRTHLTLSGEGFTGTGSTKYQSVVVHAKASVTYDDRLINRVNTVVETTLIHRIGFIEGNKHSKSLGSKRLSYEGIITA